MIEPLRIQGSAIGSGELSGGGDIKNGYAEGR